MFDMETEQEYQEQVFKKEKSFLDFRKSSLFSKFLIITDFKIISSFN
jgi:hypothetical protein